MSDECAGFEFCGVFMCSKRTPDPSKEYCNPCYRKMHGLSVCCGYPIVGLDCANEECHVKLMVDSEDYEGLKDFENDNKVHKTSRKRTLSASYSTVAADKTGSTSSKDVDSKCLICLGDISDGGVKTTCNCAAMYHKKCISTWFIETQEQHGSDRCPMCQKDLS
jgi:hypothetical protein